MHVGDLVEVIPGYPVIPEWITKAYAKNGGLIVTDIHPERNWVKIEGAGDIWYLGSRFRIVKKNPVQLSLF